MTHDGAGPLATGGPDDPRLPARSNGAGARSGEPRSGRRRLILAALAAFVVLWAFAIGYSVSRPAGEVLDADSTRTIRAACVDAVTELRALPYPADNAADEVADLIVSENEILSEMTRSLRPLEPPDSDGAAALTAWLDDWDSVIAARIGYAEEVRVVDVVQLALPSAGTTKPVTVRMGEYAEAHGLDECTPRALQVETVEGERRYGGGGTGAE